MQGISVAAVFVGTVWTTALLSLHLHRVILILNLTLLALVAAAVAILAPLYGAQGAAVATASVEVAAAVAGGVILVRGRPHLKPSLRLLPRVAAAAALGATPMLLTERPRDRPVGAVERDLWAGSAGAARVSRRSAGAAAAGSGGGLRCARRGHGGARRCELPRAPAGVGGADPPCLVHLVREVNGLGWFRAFAEALRAHPPGVDYELVLAMKGFASRAQAAPYLERGRGSRAQADLLPGSRLRHRHVPRRSPRVCAATVTASSIRTRRPLVDGWLAKLDAALARPGVGQAGATGSWASVHSWVTNTVGLPNAYRGLFPARQVLRELTMEIQREAASLGIGSDLNSARSTVSTTRLRLRSVPRVPREFFEFEPFPARHLRTNTFMISHAALRELRLSPVRNKMDIYVLESGRQSITAQLERIGLRSLVVDRAGAVHGPEQWDRSHTLWQGEQEGLLVADNQTLSYTAGAFARRNLLSTLAWGVSADPWPPPEDRQTVSALVTGVR